MAINILECRRFDATYPSIKKLRTVKDYEIDLELGNDRTVVIDEVPHQIARGNICIRKPGQTIYALSNTPLVTQSSILLTLDFTGTQSAEHYSRNIEGPLQKKWDSSLLDRLSGVIVPHSENAFISIYNELLSVAFTDRESAELLVMELLHKLNAEIFRREYAKKKPSDTACSQVLRYMKDNLEKNITLEMLADTVHLDKSYLVRLFRNTYGITPIKMLIRLRMEHACDLIANTDMPISDIATACGYPYPSYFTVEYKKHFGTTPLKHRNPKL